MVRTAETIGGVDMPAIRNTRGLRSRLRRLFRERSIDVVHVHSEFGLTAAATRVAQELGIPVVHTVHTFFWQGPDLRRFDRLAAAYPALPHSLVRRLFRHYGTRAENLLSTAVEMADLGAVFGADLTAREVDYLMAEEWATTAEDVLWRRSKLGLRIGAEDAARLDAYMAGRRRGETVSA